MGTVLAEILSFYKKNNVAHLPFFVQNQPTNYC